MCVPHLQARAAELQINFALHIQSGWIQETATYSLSITEMFIGTMHGIWSKRIPSGKAVPNRGHGHAHQTTAAKGILVTASLRRIGNRGLASSKAWRILRMMISP